MKKITNSTSNEHINGLSYVVFDHTGDLAINSVENLIETELKEYNSYFNELRRIGNAVLNDENEIITNHFKATLVNKPQYDDVGIITNSGPTEKYLQITYHDGSSSSINWKDNRLEPLSYPIFFQHGERGWGYEDRKELSMKNYLTNKMLMPESVFYQGYFDQMQVENQEGNLITTNRFQVCARNSQVYYVDMWSRNIDGKLDYIKYHQNDIILDRRGSSEELEEEEYNSNSNIFLPSSFHGSKRHLQQLARNALTIVSEHKCSTAFITLTCNIGWPEIVVKLHKDQSAFDRPELVCQVLL
jgi:hypothetical protein